MEKFSFGKVQIGDRLVVNINRANIPRDKRNLLDVPNELIGTVARKNGNRVILCYNRLAPLEPNGSDELAITFSELPYFTKLEILAPLPVDVAAVPEAQQTIVEPQPQPQVQEMQPVQQVQRPVDTINPIVETEKKGFVQKAVDWIKSLF